ncbi:hypothetical protein CBS101457_001888 [Exobasidium rhododendri]|nr:hypothetical protein CBS101457_001888 [Exobasidium rhododendri]
MVREASVPRRKSALASMKRSEAQAQEQLRDTKESAFGKSMNDEYEISPEDNIDVSDDSNASEKPVKKKFKADKKVRAGDAARVLAIFESEGETSKVGCSPPWRKHDLSYHRPLLLEDGGVGRKGRCDLLQWFDSVSTRRSMPWRKTWIDPSTVEDKGELRELLKRRAYEVWISEIMLQQTRVQTVISYWTNWIEKWPTIENLAMAKPDEVLSAWRGLGYYSRATRIHTAAKKVVEDAEMQGLLPETAESLEKKVPGVGRYTGGAISSIVFGNAAAMVDGNVLRVLSRQLGVYGDVKGSKQVIDLLWKAADVLVKKVATDACLQDERVKTERKETKSDRPGRWGQALMELGSTICTPTPVCRTCPITATCRTFGEGRILADKKRNTSHQSKARKGDITDVEDLCAVCEPFEETADLDEEDGLECAGEKKQALGKGGDKPATARAKQATLSSFAFTNRSSASSKKQTMTTTGKVEIDSAEDWKIVEDYSKKFPMKVIKKTVRQQETIVCAIRNQDGKYLLHQRPEKGLLAGLWELPSRVLPESNDSVASARKEQAIAFVKSALLDPAAECQQRGEIAAVPWLFSHLKLTMHVHLFLVETEDETSGRWATKREVEDESMGTGMRKCWSLVKDL